MQDIICKNCGGNQFREQNGYRTCIYCDTKYAIEFGERKDGIIRGISLGDDIEMLLRKCRNDPKNAARYANRILDIDPSNTEALAYLRRR